MDLVFYREPKDNDIVYSRLSILCEFVQQYTYRVSRERAVEFTFDSLGHNDHPNSNEDPRIKAQLRKRFDNWLKEQEEQQ